MKERTLCGVVKLILAAVIGGLVALVGGWDKGMQTLVVFIVLDVGTGVARAILQKDLSSKESYKGGLKKLLILVVVAVATQVDRYAETNLARNGAIAFYCGSEALSILENVAKSGVKIPPFLEKILKALRNGESDEEEE